MVLVRRALAKEMGAALLLVEARDIVRVDEEEEGGEVIVPEAGATGTTRLGGFFPPLQDHGDPMDDQGMCYPVMIFDGL